MRNRWKIAKKYEKVWEHIRFAKKYKKKNIKNMSNPAYYIAVVFVTRKINYKKRI